MFSGHFYEKWMSVRERNIKLLLEAVPSMATKETATCIITIEMVMCIVHCRKYHLSPGQHAAAHWVIGYGHEIQSFIKKGGQQKCLDKALHVNVTSYIF